ncbi:hypothetical protein MRX96_039953 [Rhipicephalus microplus]
MARRRGVFGPLALGTALASAVLAAALSLPPASMALTLAPDPESGTEPWRHRRTHAASDPATWDPATGCLPACSPDRSPGYNNFSVVISGNPKKYVPGEAYTGTKTPAVSTVSAFVWSHGDRFSSLDPQYVQHRFSTHPPLLALLTWPSAFENVHVLVLGKDSVRVSIYQVCGVRQ